MHVLILVYLGYFSFILGQIHSRPSDITVGKYSTSNQIEFLDYFILGGVFTDRDEGSNIHPMEGVFKYAIFHYNRLAKNAHNISFKIRLQEETLSLIAAESAVQTVQDGREREDFLRDFIDELF